MHKMQPIERLVPFITMSFLFSSATANAQYQPTHEYRPATNPVSRHQVTRGTKPIPLPPASRPTETNNNSYPTNNGYYAVTHSNAPDTPAPMYQKEGRAPILPGATNGTIGPPGGDTTSIMGVMTAGTVRVNHSPSYAWLVPVSVCSVAAVMFALTMRKKRGALWVLGGCAALILIVGGFLFGQQDEIAGVIGDWFSGGTWDAEPYS